MKTYLVLGAVIAALSAALWWSHHTIEGLKTEAGKHQETISNLRGEVKSSQSLLDAKNREIASLNRDLNDLQKQKAAIDRDLQAAHTKLKEVISHDAKAKAWANTRLPAAICRLLNNDGLRAKANPGALRECLGTRGTSKPAQPDGRHHQRRPDKPD